MLTYLQNFRVAFGPFRLFEYVTFRSGGALLTAMFLVILLGPWVIRKLKKISVPKSARMEGLADEKFIDHSKDKTPAMGGLLIMGSVIVSTLLWGALNNRMLHIFLIVLVTLTILGFMDDFIKARYKRDIRDGVSGKIKLLVQTIVTVLAVYLLYKTPNAVTQQIFLPFFKDPVWFRPDTAAEKIEFLLPFLQEPLFTWPLYMMPLCLLIMLGFNTLVVAGASNGVNLTDGKDGLAAGCAVFCTLAYAAVAYLCGHAVFSEYLAIPSVPGAGEVCIFASAIAGACIGFLWYNCHKASVFMGDTGSLPLGGCIGLIAVLLGQQILLLIIGFVFVMESLSVMIQVAVFKLTHGRKRVFLCAPIHHHFERLGWSETQIVTRFWIIAGVCALLGLATLKLH